VVCGRKSSGKESLVTCENCKKDFDHMNKYTQPCAFRAYIYTVLQCAAVCCNIYLQPAAFDIVTETWIIYTYIHQQLFAFGVSFLQSQISMDVLVL